MEKPLINITRRQALLFAAFLVLYEFLTYIANDMIMPGMLEVVQSFNAPETAVANSLTAYVLGGASLQLILGPLSDRFGRRPVMLAGVILFLFCTLFIANSASMQQFITARFFQGMGLCFIGVIGYATLQEIYAERDAVKLIAIMANISILAPLLGPLLGSVFIHLLSWRMIFLSIGALSLIALWGIWRFMPEPIGQTKTDGQVIQPESLSLSVIIGNYKKLLTCKLFAFGSIALGILTVPCLCWIALSPIMLMGEAQLSVYQYALWQVPVFGAAIVGNWVLHFLSDRYQLRTILWLGAIISISSLLLCFILPSMISFHYIWLMPGLILYFFSLGITTAPLERLILFALPVAKGTASAMMSMILMLLNAIGLEVANYLYAQHKNIMLSSYFALNAFLLFIVLFLAFSQSKRK